MARQQTLQTVLDAIAQQLNALSLKEDREGKAEA